MDKSEQNRITLSIAFIATHLTLILSLYKVFPYDSTSFFRQFCFVIFVVYGAITALFFFMYLVFTALKLDFNKNKEVMWEQEISQEKVERFRKFFYNMGVRSIFWMFVYPVYFLYVLAFKYFNPFVAFVIFALLLSLGHFIVLFICRD